MPLKQLVYAAFFQTCKCMLPPSRHTNSLRQSSHPNVSRVGRRGLRCRRCASANSQRLLQCSALNTNKATTQPQNTTTPHKHMHTADTDTNRRRHRLKFCFGLRALVCNICSYIQYVNKFYTHTHTHTHTHKIALPLGIRGKRFILRMRA
jgi:hypothetical protein